MRVGDFLYPLFFLFLPFGASYIPSYALGQPLGTLSSLHIYIYFICAFIYKKKRSERFQQELQVQD